MSAPALCFLLEVSQPMLFKAMILSEMSTAKILTVPGPTHTVPALGRLCHLQEIKTLKHRTAVICKSMLLYMTWERKDREVIGIAECVAQPNKYVCKSDVEHVCEYVPCFLKGKHRFPQRSPP